MFINGCSGFGNKPPIIINNYCSLAMDLPKSESITSELKRIKANSIELFKFVEISATTKKCECKKTEQEKQSCWEEFQSLQ